MIYKYAQKLLEQDLVIPEGPVIGALDTGLVWNRDDKIRPLLEEVVAGLNISAILFGRPAEPYFSMINHLIQRLPNTETALYPQDNESRTFLHDLPVVRRLSVNDITAALKQRKCAIIPGEGIITYGTVSPEQAYINYCSVCFSLFLKTFVDHYTDIQTGHSDPVLRDLVYRGGKYYRTHLASASTYSPLMKGPFAHTEDVIRAICEVGRLTVEKHMVDSFFGNVSYRLKDTIHVTQTGSTLDELEGYIDPCPMNNSRCTAITASSEFTAHKSVYHQTPQKAILHGHPKFTVIFSMLCNDRKNCENRNSCHIKCSRDRRIGDIPILPGESGTGPYSIATTLPPALARNRAAVIYGHGIFTTGQKDFTDAFQTLVEVEKNCFDAYFESIRASENKL